MLMTIPEFSSWFHAIFNISFHLKEIVASETFASNEFFLLLLENNLLQLEHFLFMNLSHKLTYISSVADPAAG